MKIKDCVFSDPVYWEKATEILIPLNGTTLKTETWNFLTFHCTTTDTAVELIINPTTTASFYLKKSFSYGDFFTMGFLTIFVLFGITKIIWETFVKK